MRNDWEIAVRSTVGGDACNAPRRERSAVRHRSARTQRLEGARGRRRQSEPRLHRRGRLGCGRRQAGPALCPPGRRQLAAAAEALLLRISCADTAGGARAGLGAGDPSFRRRPGADHHGVSGAAAHHPAPRPDRRPPIAEHRPGHRPVHGPHAVSRLRSLDADQGPQGRSGAVRRQCRALRHHREPGVFRPLFRRQDEPAYVAAARRPGRRTARRPRPQGRGAAAEASSSPPMPKRCCMAICIPARSWSPTPRPG